METFVDGGGSALLIMRKFLNSLALWGEHQHQRIMITPKTHPEKFWRLDHEGRSWNVPTYIWNTLTDSVNDSILEAYKAACPDELEDGRPTAVKYIAWQSKNNNYSRVVTRTICVPIDNAPPLEGDLYDLLSNAEVNRIVNFTKPVTTGNASTPTVAPASETKTEPESASTPAA